MISPPPSGGQPADPGPAPRAGREGAASGRILVVEDDDGCRAAVVDLLRGRGYAVEGVPDGDAGLRSILSRSPDLAVVDFNMPGLNGYELTRELRRREETRRLPVILMTGAANRSHLRSLEMDVSCFLDKPVSAERLLSEVRRLVGPGEGACPKAAPAPPAGIPAEARPRAAEDLEIEQERPESEGELAADDSSLIGEVNRILIRAVELGASDIHIEPREKHIGVRLRMNGSLQQLCLLPASLGRKIATRVKIMSKLLITERRLPQDGQIRAVIHGKRTEFRVSTLPSLHGEKIVIRVLGGGKVQPDVDRLGFSPRDLECVRRALQSQHGLILVTGPTGSGKTTTLYTMLSSLNSPDVNIMTAEDPVEYELPGLTQVHVNPRIGLTFESVLRSFLRQDPDVMLVGEIRDKETAEIAIKASITGHLVFSTLHTNGAPATISRLVHMGVAPFLVAASVKLVVAQRLVKTLCPECKCPAPLGEDQQRLLTQAELAGMETVYRAAGCPACLDSGYRGRMPIFEVMPVRSQEMRRRILVAEDADALAEAALGEGMTSLRQAAVAAVAAGRTSMAEAVKIIVAD